MTETNEELLESLEKVLKGGKLPETSREVITKINTLHDKIDKYKDDKNAKSMVAAMLQEKAALEELCAILKQRENSNASILADLKEIAGSRGINTSEKDFLKQFTELYTAESARMEKIQESIDRAIAEGKTGDVARLEKEKRNAEKKITTFKSKLDTEGYKDLLQALENWENSDAAKEAVDNAKELEEIEERIAKKTKETTSAEDEHAKAIARSKAQNDALEKSYDKIARVAKEAWTQFKSMGTVWMDYNQQAISDAKRLGITSTHAANAYNRNLMAGSKELMRNFGLSREEATKMQETFQTVTGKAIIFNKEQMSDIVAASSLMGKENVAAAIQSMDAMGSTSERATELMDANYARAKNSGLDTVKASEAFVKNMALANKMTFKGGVDGISKMTILSQKLKFNLDSVASVADKFSTIEGAIEGSAQLQMLGGSGAMFGGNPMQMMYEALNNGEALTERLTKMWGDQAVFDKKTGEAKLSGLQLQIIKAQAKAAGMNEADAVSIAKNQAKIKDIEAHSEGVISKYGRESDEMSTVANKAVYNKELGQWTVNWFDKNGQLQSGTTESLTPQQMDEIMADKMDPVTDIKGNVKKIAQTLISMRDEKNSLWGMFETGKAETVDGVMTSLDSELKDAKRGNGWTRGVSDFFTDRGFGSVLGTVIQGAIGLGIGGAIMKGTYKGLARGGRGLVNLFRGGSSVANVASNAGNIGNAVANGAVANSGSVVGGVTTNGAGLSASGGAAGAGLGTVAAAGAGGLIVGGIVGYGVYNHMSSEADAIREKEDRRITALASNNQTWSRRGINANYRDRELESRRIANENRDSKNQGEAVGTGVGIAGGAGVGAAAGAAIGSAFFGVGAIPGAVIGGIIGAVAGGLGGNAIGRNVASQQDNNTIIGKEQEEINENDADDNVKKIVLPVQSIDYNVALIANQLGVISAMPARNNVYLDAEAAGEIQVQGQAIETGYVNPVESSTYSQPYTPRGSSEVTVNVVGEITLNCQGQNIGKLNRQELSELMKNTEFQQAIKEMIKDSFSHSPTKSNSEAWNDKGSIGQYGRPY